MPIAGQGTAILRAPRRRRGPKMPRPRVLEAAAPTGGSPRRAALRPWCMRPLLCAFLLRAFLLRDSPSRCLHRAGQRGHGHAPEKIGPRRSRLTTSRPPALDQPDPASSRPASAPYQHSSSTRPLPAFFQWGCAARIGGSASPDARQHAASAAGGRSSAAGSVRGRAAEFPERRAPRHTHQHSPSTTSPSRRRSFRATSPSAPPLLLSGAHRARRIRSRTAENDRRAGPAPRDGGASVPSARASGSSCGAYRGGRGNNAGVKLAVIGGCQEVLKTLRGGQDVLAAARRRSNISAPHSVRAVTARAAHSGSYARPAECP